MPFIHLNGSSAPSLRAEYLAAYSAVGVAMDKFQKIDFNARDYYPEAGAWVWEKALAERQAHWEALGVVLDYLFQITEHVDKRCKD
jgi:hypothetical protein